jgi:hypothetical protein
VEQVGNSFGETIDANEKNGLKLQTFYVLDHCCPVKN